jgi:hypothetical protein
VIDRIVISSALEGGVRVLADELGIPPEDLPIDEPSLFALAEHVTAADGWLELRAVLPDVEVVLHVVHVKRDPDAV